MASTASTKAAWGSRTGPYPEENVPDRDLFRGPVDSGDSRARSAGPPPGVLHPSVSRAWGRGRRTGAGGLPVAFRFCLPAHGEV